MWELDVKAQKVRTGQSQRYAAGPWMGWMRGQHWPLSQDIQEGQGDSPPFADAPADPFPMGPAQVALVTAASAVS